MRQVKVGDKIKLSGRQISDQNLSGAIIQSMLDKGYCRVVHVLSRDIATFPSGLEAVTVAEDVGMTIMDYDLID